MDRLTKRVLLYITLGVILYGAATVFVEDRIRFIVIFGTGVLLVLAAEVLFWIQMVRLSLKRRKQ